jgi:hypothetical protein
MQPRSLVFAVIVAAAAVGGGRRVWRGWQARRAANRLGRPDVTPAEVMAAAGYGRAVLRELYPLLDPARRPEQRRAAARALGELWRRDELVGEEERAVATRIHEVSWRSRRRYPRAMARAVPVEVAVRLPGLEVAGLEWSGRIKGARRASVEAGSEWMAVDGTSIRFELLPTDYEGRGPQELILEPRLRFRGSVAWEHDLPHARYTIEWDPMLELRALEGTADASRAEQVRSAVQPLEAEAGRFVALNEALAVRGPLGLGVAEGGLPTALAHQVYLELEGVPGCYRLGEVVAGERGGRFEFARIEEVPLERLSGPRRVRLRYRLVPDLELGWSDPEVRSVWPEEVVTDWSESEVVRR